MDENKELRIITEMTIDYMTQHNFTECEGSMFIYYIFKNINNSETCKTNEIDLDIYFIIHNFDKDTVKSRIDDFKIKRAMEYFEILNGFNIYFILSVLINLVDYWNCKSNEILNRLYLKYNKKVYDNSHDIKLKGVTIEHANDVVNGGIN